jgi:Plasmid pRiA4b ORF-3-like protein
VIQVVMGWENSHMHQFLLNGKYYGQAGTDDLDLEDEEDIRLSQIFTGRKKPRLVYEYDFGDSWRHEIRLEKRSEPEPKVKYPRCVEGARACPPEDCGGAWGYADFLEAISDKKHPEHRDMKEWIGGKFDPEKFSIEAVNRELKNLR